MDVKLEGCKLFVSDRCPHSTQLLENLKIPKNVDVVKVDEAMFSDDLKEMLKFFGVRRVPSLVAIYNTGEFDLLVGSKCRQGMEELLLSETEVEKFEEAPATTTKPNVSAMDSSSDGFASFSSKQATTLKPEEGAIKGTDMDKRLKMIEEQRSRLDRDIQKRNETTLNRSLSTRQN